MLTINWLFYHYERKVGDVIIKMFVSHLDTFKVSGLNSNNWNYLLQDISDMGYKWYESCM